jgi:hypothetical protein
MSLRHISISSGESLAWTKHENTPHNKVHTYRTYFSFLAKRLEFSRLSLEDNDNQMVSIWDISSDNQIFYQFL